MKRTVDRLWFLLVAVAALALTACEEDVHEAALGEQEDTLKILADVPAPAVRAVDSAVPTTLKFGFSVTAEQAQDTVCYLLLLDSEAAPSAKGLLSHTAVSKLPMGGSYFRSTFQSGLSAQTTYVVYAIIKKGRYFSEMASLSLTTGASQGTIDQETPTSTNNPQPAATRDTTAAPVLEPRGVPQNDLISLAVLVNSDQTEGTLHYLYFTESKNPGMLTSQDLVNHRLTETFSMSGATIKKFNFPATSNTKYYIYAVLQVGHKQSRVVVLTAKTV